MLVYVQRNIVNFVYNGYDYAISEKVGHIFALKHVINVWIVLCKNYLTATHSLSLQSNQLSILYIIILLVTVQKMRHIAKSEIHLLLEFWPAYCKTFDSKEDSYKTVLGSYNL